MMNTWTESRVFRTLLLVALVVPMLGARPAPVDHTAYVAGGLADQSGEISVIVTGPSATEAAAAVETAGGQVTSDLWLIDGVAARLPAAGLKKLAVLDGVRAVVENQRVETAQTDGPPLDWDYTQGEDYASLGAWTESA